MEVRATRISNAFPNNALIRRPARMEDPRVAPCANLSAVPALDGDHVCALRSIVIISSGDHDRRIRPRTRHSDYAIVTGAASRYLRPSARRVPALPMMRRLFGPICSTRSSHPGRHVAGVAGRQQTAVISPRRQDLHHTSTPDVARAQWSVALVAHGGRRASARSGLVRGQEPSRRATC